MPDPFVAVTVAEAFMQFSQTTISAVSPLSDNPFLPRVRRRSLISASRLRTRDARKTLRG
jgi:hypothetical protein